MKKSLTIMAAMLLGAIAADAQYIMKVNTNDGKSVEYNVSDISSVTWESVGAPQYEYVDLGLSVMWATCNIGATKPEEYGDYFAWGETETKSSYEWSNYKHCMGTQTSFTKYCNQSNYGYNGFTDRKAVLDPEDDAAHVIWGGDWRMPTEAEIEELIDSGNCDWIYFGKGNTLFGGVAGYAVISKRPGFEGNYIFLPASARDSKVAGRQGYYWSSSLEESCNYNACTLSFTSDSYEDGVESRESELTIRPVFSAGRDGYVDLGLSVKWAKCNVGATEPEEYGDYFAWGETLPKFYYDWSNYKYCKGSQNTITKYCIDSSYGYDGYIDNKTVLDPEDDAAHVNWGGDWRMPTDAEYQELCNRNNCTWTWTTLNGVSGYKVQSKKPGYTDKWIFLPAAGWDRLNGMGTGGDYWSSSLCSEYNYTAWGLDFVSGDWHSGTNLRFNGQSVRAVCP